MYKIHSTRITVSIIFECAIKLDKILSGIKLIWYYSASEFNSLYTSFSGKNIIYMTMRVNLIHSKLVFFKKIQKLNTLKWKKKSSLEQCKWIALCT